MARTPGGTISSFTLLSTPDEPTITSVTIGIGSATVAFTPPTDVGDAAVSSYVVTAVNESTGASTGATGSASPITLSGLGGQTVKIRMQALNAYGPGRLTEYDTGNGVYSGASLWAVGGNQFGQIGDNTAGLGTNDKSSPVQVGALATWSKIAALAESSVALKTDGTIWSWGRNDLGQLGTSSVINRSSPVQIGALTDWSVLGVGCTGNFLLVQKTNGTIWSWGVNGDGQLGDGTRVNRSSPVQIGALTDWIKISSGYKQCSAIRSNGSLWVWGSNNQGQLGLNDIVSRSSPVQVGALTNWASTSAGFENTGAITTSGQLWMWGNNGSGNLGIPISYKRSSPVQVGSLTNWALLSVGNSTSSSVKTDGTLWSWGFNSSGQLGDSTVVSKSSPIQVGLLTDWSLISIGSSGQALAIRNNGTWWSWGFNTNGSLGLGNTLNRSSPVQVGSNTQWLSVSCSSSQTLALYGVV
jgi:alpha-tubulin suppressor-like RCC1 family protein